MAGRPLHGRRILVVEDEYYVARELHLGLVAAGASVIGPASSLDIALDLIKASSTIDAAVLDINLSGEMVFPAADLLLERGVPIIFSTGYDRSAIPARFNHVPRCEKPFGFIKLQDTLLEATGARKLSVSGRSRQ